MLTSELHDWDYSNVDRGTDKPIPTRAYDRSMSDSDGPFDCEGCGAAIALEDARRTKTIGGLDPTKWQTLCCPDCGSRLQTVYVGE